jgi:hypothetical protein
MSSLLRVVDEFSDFYERDGRAHAVEIRDHSHELIAEESARGSLGLPQVDIRRATVLLIDRKCFLAKFRQTLETRAMFMRDRLNPGRIELVPVLKLDDHTLHF